MTQPDAAGTGSVLKVFLFTDLVGSTGLKQRLGDARGAEVITRHNELFRGLLAEHRGAERGYMGDGFCAMFDSATDALRCALAFQVGLSQLDTPEPLRARIGLHMGEAITLPGADPASEPEKVMGLAIDTASRVMSLAQGNQVLLTRMAFDTARQRLTESPDGRPVAWLAHGPYLFKGLDEPFDVFEVGIEGFSRLSPPTESPKARRALTPGEEDTLGWRPAMGLTIPGREGWRIEAKLGQGGFGEVWLAQNRHTRERRTFKFCFRADRLRGLKRELTLFRLMKEALGDRPDIARLRDVHLDAPPFYLELDYTAGGDLATWAERRGGIGTIDAATRMEIVAQVAGALAAAHSVGVIHKDVKPSNVLIEEGREGELQVRLTDFGISRIVEPGALAAAGVTATGFSTTTIGAGESSSASGTRLYMAPELIAGAPPSIQTDVYSLGVLLYQVAVGDLRRPVAQGWEREIEDELTREDIRACIDGAPENRPASANEVARRLRSLPERRERREAERRAAVRARLTRRRRQWLGAGVAVAAVLTASLSVIAMRENRLRREAQVQGELRRIEAETARSVSDFMMSLFDAADPLDASPEIAAGEESAEFSELSRAEQINARRLLDEGFRRLESELRGEPEIRARLMVTIGRVYDRLDEFDRAEVMFAEALELRIEIFGERSDEAAEVLTQLGRVAYGRRDFARAEEFHGRALEAKKAIHGERSLEAAACMNTLAMAISQQGGRTEAERLYRDVIAIRTEAYGPDHVSVLGVMNNLANNLRAQDRIGDARAMHERVLASRIANDGEDSLAVATTHNNLALILARLDEREAARAMFEASLQSRRSHLGTDHPLVAQSLMNLGKLYTNLGRLDDAEIALREGHRIYRNRLGDGHPYVRSSLSNMTTLASEIRRAGDLARAEAMLLEIVATRREIGDIESFDMMKTLDALGLAARDAGRLDDAERNFEEAFDYVAQYRSDRPRDLALGLSRFNTLGIRFSRAGRLDDAERVHRTNLERRRQWLGERHRDVSVSRHNLGRLLRDRGEFQEAETLLRGALAIKRESYGEQHASTVNTLGAIFRLAGAMTRAGDLEPAEALHREVIEWSRTIEAGEPAGTANRIAGLAKNLQRQGRHAQAKALFEESLAMHRAAREGPHADTAESLNGLAIAAAELGELDEAETRLNEALDMWRALAGDNARSLANVALNLRRLGRYAADAGRHEQAVRIGRASYELLLGARGSADRSVALAALDWGAALALEGNSGAAIEAFERAEASFAAIEARDGAEAATRNDWAWTLVLKGRAEAARDRKTEADVMWARAIERIEPYAEDSEDVNLLDTWAQALMELGRIEEARPVVERLIAMDHDDPGFLALARRHGLIDPRAWPRA